MRTKCFFLSVLMFFFKIHSQTKNDIINLNDTRTKECVAFKKMPSIPNGALLDDIIYKKVGNLVYERVIRDNLINVRWFGDDSDAIQKAINYATVLSGRINLTKYSVFLPEGTYTIDKKIVIKNTQGINFFGSGVNTTLRIKDGLHLETVLELNGVAYSTFQDFSFSGSQNSSCDSFIHLFWGDMVGSTQNLSNPQRSSMQNSFRNIKNISGRFKNAVLIDGHNQNDTTIWDNCSFNGMWTPKESFYQSAFYIGDGSTGNNLIHNFQNNYHTGLRTAYVFAGSGGSVTGGGASNVGTFVRRIGVNETLLVSSVRLEGTQMIYTTDGYLKGIHEAADNITFQNLYYSGIGSDRKHFQFPDDGILIFNGGGNFNLIGSTIHQLPSGKAVYFKLSGAQNDNFHNSFNIIGCNIEANYDRLFIADPWAKAAISIVGSNETQGTSMGRHVKNLEKDFNYKSQQKQGR